jgi:hypothetical protein
VLKPNENNLIFSHGLKCTECIFYKDSFEDNRQLLKFKEIKTGVEVILIGAMHYNPYSIELTKTVLEELGERNDLGSVIIESCVERWNKTTLMQPTGSTLRKLLDNEMQVAAEVALHYSRPLVLGDQIISLTNKRMIGSFIDSVKDSLKPNGLKSIYDELNASMIENFPSGSNYLSLKHFMDPKLLAGAPFSMIKYPIALLLKSPVLLGPFFLFIVYLNNENAEFVGITLYERVIEVLTSIAIVLLEFLLLGRTLLISLLSERNEVLATNIRKACERLVSEKKGGQLSDTPVVVAVLGMAQCNGVMTRLIGPSNGTAAG